MDIPRFCSNCGAQLNATANFCASCGKQVQKNVESDQPRPVRASAVPAAPASPYAPPAAQPVPAPPAAASALAQETTHLVLAGAARHSGFLGFKVESFIIVFTDRRIIFALQTSQMMQENIRRARQEAEQQGKGFFGKWGAQLGANYGQQYWQLPPQQILAEQPGNFAIHCEHLRAIRMREDHGDENSTSTYTLEFDTTAGKHKFRFGSLRIRELKKQFQGLYGSIVR
jgi:hypothetical protein